MSYLGREDFAPAGARKAVLQERFGFDCNCQRCRCVPINRHEALHARLWQLLQPSTCTCLVIEQHCHSFSAPSVVCKG